MLSPRSAFPALALLLVAVPVRAQPPEAQRRPFDPFRDCPHDRVSLQDADPARIAWAADQRCKVPGDPAAAGEALRAALRRLCAEDSPAAQAAAVHVLHALHQLEVAVPFAGLEPVRGVAAAPLRTVLMLRAASAAGGELLHAFQQLHPADAEWEVLGGALATRRHRTFALELHAGFAPRLHVLERRPPPAGRLAKALPEPGFPNALLCHWERDRRGMLELKIRRAEFQPSTVATAAMLRPLDQDRARLRWLSMMAGRPDPVADSHVCQLVLDANESAAESAARVEAARLRLQELLAVLDAGLRRKGALPADLGHRLPAPTVVWEQGEPAARPADVPGTGRRRP